MSEDAISKTLQLATIATAIFSVSFCVAYIRRLRRELTAAKELARVRSLQVRGYSRFVRKVMSANRFVFPSGELKADLDAQFQAELEKMESDGHGA